MAIPAWPYPNAGAYATPHRAILELQDLKSSHFSGFPATLVHKIRIKCGWNAVFPQQPWCKMALIAGQISFHI